MTAGWPQGKIIVFLVLLVAAIGLTYANSLKGEFIWDDIMFIQNNRYLDDIGNLKNILLAADAEGTDTHNPYYRPVAVASFMIDKFLYGSNPLGFHVTNVLLHVLTALFLYLVLARLTRPLTALVATGLFALHPVHAEPVAYISARADLLAGAFMTISYYLFLRHDWPRDKKILVCSLLTFGLALFSKIVAVVLPFVLAIHLFTQKRPNKEYLTLAPYGVIVVIFLLLRNEVVAVGQWTNDPFLHRLATSGTIMLSHMARSFFPVNLQVFYDLPLKTTLLDLEVCCSWFLVILATGVLFVCCKSARLARVGLVWYFTALIPVSGIVMLIYPCYVADRYLYIPLIGMAMSFAILAESFFSKFAFTTLKTPLLVAVPALLICSGFSISSRTTSWENNYTFWNRVIIDAPNRADAHLNDGISHLNKMELVQAREALDRSVRLGNDSKYLHYQMARLGYYVKDLDLAQKHIVIAIEKDQNNSLYWYNLSDIMIMKGDFSSAFTATKKSLAADPNNSFAQYRLETLNEYFSSPVN